MAATTHISWADHTYNRWIGCSRVSPGCAQCYAEEDQDHRRGRVTWGPGGRRIGVSAATARAPFAWDAAARRDGVRRRVFASSVADAFDQHPSINPAWKVELWQTIRATTHLDWLVLTKRPEAIAGDLEQFAGGIPPPNVWIGFSAENQTWFDRRWPIVRALPFKIKFVSFEPALGPIRLGAGHEGLDWVIFGGETSLRRGESRPADLQWARDLRDDCRRQKIAFWFKQSGSWLGGRWVGKTSALYAAEHDRLDGEAIHELPKAR